MSLPSRPARRRVDGGDGSAYTTKEVILRVEAKLDAYISAHDARHAAEAAQDYAARTDANATAVGRSLLKAQVELAADIAELTKAVDSHERSIQRLLGAVALIVFLGGGAFVLAALSAAGRLIGFPLP